VIRSHSILFMVRSYSWLIHFVFFCFQPSSLESFPSFSSNEHFVFISHFPEPRGVPHPKFVLFTFPQTFSDMAENLSVGRRTSSNSNIIHVAGSPTFFCERFLRTHSNSIFQERLLSKDWKATLNRFQNSLRIPISQLAKNPLLYY
jgi:hypothetical protein